MNTAQFIIGLILVIAGSAITAYFAIQYQSDLIKQKADAELKFINLLNCDNLFSYSQYQKDYWGLYTGKGTIQNDLAKVAEKLWQDKCISESDKSQSKISGFGKESSYGNWYLILSNGKTLRTNCSNSIYPFQSNSTHYRCGNDSWVNASEQIDQLNKSSERQSYNYHDFNPNQRD